MTAEGMTPEHARHRAAALSHSIEALCNSYDFGGMVAIGLDEGGRISMASCGLDADTIIDLLVDAIARVQMQHGIDVTHRPETMRTPEGGTVRLAVPRGIAQEDYGVAGSCPECKAKVWAPKVRPPNPEETPCVGVCRCGTFLQPTYGPDDLPTGVEVMTLEAIGDLDDELRSTLVRLRKDGYCTGMVGRREPQK